MEGLILMKDTMKQAAQVAELLDDRMV